MSTWTRVVNGLTNRYGFTGIVASQLAPGNAYISADGDGVFVSEDSGVVWKSMNAGLRDLRVRLLAIGSEPADVLIAADEAGALLRHGGSAEWQQVATSASGFSAAAFAGDSIAFAGAGDGKLFRSTDGGKEWTPVWQSDAQTAITAIEPSPDYVNDATVFIGTDGSGIYRTNDAGETFERVLGGDEHITDIEISPNFSHDKHIYATTWSGVFLSKDGGTIWSESAEGLTQSSQAESEKYRSPHFRSIRAIRDEPEGKGYKLLVGGFDGLFASTDYGSSWKELATMPANLIMSFAVSPPDSNGIHSIAIGTYGAGTAVSRDEGLSWTQANDGLPDLRIRDLVFPRNFHESGLLFTATKGALAYKRMPEDAWESVMLRQEGLLSLALNIARPPVEKLMRSSEAFSAFVNNYLPRPSGVHTIHPTIVSLSPYFEQDNAIFIGTGGSGLFLSRDGGDSFSRVWHSSSDEVGAMSISPNFPDDRFLLISLSEFSEPPNPDALARLLRSNDAGNSFSTVSFGNYEPRGRLHVALSPDFDNDHTVFAGSLSGLVYSRNGAADWQRPLGPKAVVEGAITDLAISPSYAIDGTVLVSVKGSGLFISADHGVSFNSIGSGLTKESRVPSHFYSFPATSAAIKFSPDFKRNRAIFGTTGHELLKSPDGGSTWHQIALPEMPRTHR